MLELVCQPMKPKHMPQPSISNLWMAKFFVKNMNWSKGNVNPPNICHMMNWQKHAKLQLRNCWNLLKLVKWMVTL